MRRSALGTNKRQDGLFCSSKRFQTWVVLDFTGLLMRLD